MTPTAPLDEIHAASMNAVQRIRDEVARRSAEIHQWTPRPCPPKDVS